MVLQWNEMKICYSSFCIIILIPIEALCKYKVPPLWKQSGRSKKGTLGSMSGVTPQINTWLSNDRWKITLFVIDPELTVEKFLEKSGKLSVDKKIRFSWNRYGRIIIQNLHWNMVICWFCHTDIVQVLINCSDTTKPSPFT